MQQQDASNSRCQHVESNAIAGIKFVGANPKNDVRLGIIEFLKSGGPKNILAISMEFIKDVSLEELNTVLDEMTAMKQIHRDGNLYFVKEKK